MPYKDIEKQREYVREYQREYRKKHKELGLCGNCNQPIMPNSSQCIYHHYKGLEYCRTPKIKDAHRVRERARYIKNQLDNKCPHCGAPLMEGETRLCIACIVKHNETSNGARRRINYATAN